MGELDADTSSRNRGSSGGSPAGCVLGSTELRGVKGVDYLAKKVDDFERFSVMRKAFKAT